MIISQDDILNYCKTVYNTNSIKPEFVTALVLAESKGEEYALSKMGAMGLLQLTPIVLLDLLKRFDLRIAPYDWKQNLFGGVRYLDWLFSRTYYLNIEEHLSFSFIIASWNWGYSNTKSLYQKLLQEDNQKEFIYYVPTETRQLYNRFKNYFQILTKEES